MARIRYPWYLTPLKYSRATVDNAATTIQTALRGFFARFRTILNVFDRARFRERKLPYQKVYQRRRERQRRLNGPEVIWLECILNLVCI